TPSGSSPGDSDQGKTRGRSPDRLPRSRTRPIPLLVAVVLMRAGAACRWWSTVTLAGSAVVAHAGDLPWPRCAGRIDRRAGDKPWGGREVNESWVSGWRVMRPKGPGGG